MHQSSAGCPVIPMPHVPSVTSPPMVPLLHLLPPLFSLQTLVCPSLLSAPEGNGAGLTRPSTPKTSSKLTRSSKEGRRLPLVDSKSRAPVPACISTLARLRRKLHC